MTTNIKSLNKSMVNEITEGFCLPEKEPLRVFFFARNMIDMLDQHILLECVK